MASILDGLSSILLNIPIVCIYFFADIGLIFVFLDG